MKVNKEVCFVEWLSRHPVWSVLWPSLLFHIHTRTIFWLFRVCTLLLPLYENTLQLVNASRWRFKAVSSHLLAMCCCHISSPAHRKKTKKTRQQQKLTLVSQLLDNKEIRNKGMEMFGLFLIVCLRFDYKCGWLRFVSIQNTEIEVNKGKKTRPASVDCNHPEKNTA